VFAPVGEVSVNPGGEPERDDKGLPPVDIKVPDDARELDPDVQAYRRELRARRRDQRHGRLHRSLSRDGVVLPLLACCLILALITGTLLTVFSATSGPLSGLPRSASSASSKPSAAGLEMVTTETVPDATIAVQGASLSAQQLDMMVLVPANCRCTQAFQWLAGVASKAEVLAYVISTPATRAEVASLYRQLPPKLRSTVTIAEEADNQDLLSPAKVPPGITPGQLTAILVGRYSAPTWVSRVSPRDSQTPLTQLLAST
jgi:hypothetical protein